MTPKILSLNVGPPQTVEWDGKTIETSMSKKPVAALEVSLTQIAGDKFVNTHHHGTPDAVLYAYGADAIADFMATLGRDTFAHGELGENLTLDRLDESDVSVGDLFKIGDVIAQATFPRIPCVKINFVMKHPLGQKTMIQAKRSGVYFRIIKPGRIDSNSSFELFEGAKVRFTIAEVYEKMIGAVKVTPDDIARVHANGAFPMDRIARWLKP